MSKPSQEAINALKVASNKILKDYASIGADAGDLSKKIVNSFEAAFDRPPVEEFEMILQRNFSQDEVRVCMFAPKEEQIKYYPPLMTAANAAEIEKLEKDHPLKKLKPLMLSLVFLLHRHSWKGFMEEYIVRGGLDIMATMLAEPNLYYRGQVVEIMVTATDSDKFDWFEPKNDIMSRTLHIRLLELSEHPSFLTNILANRVGSYPGGSMRCLTLLAFWLSWVRAMYTKDQVLQLSPTIVTELKKWGREVGRDEEGNIDLSDVGDAADNVIEVGGGDDDADADGEEEGIRDEKKLVKTLLQDFTADQFKDKAGYSTGEGAGSGEGGGSVVTGIVRPAQDEEVKKKVKEVFEAIDDDKILAFASKKGTSYAAPGPDTLPSPPSSTSTAPTSGHKNGNATELKKEGNRLFGNGDYMAALSAYDKAVAAVDVEQGQEEEGEDFLAALHFNRAASYWKIASVLAPKATGAGAGAGASTSKGIETDEETLHYMVEAVRKAGGVSADGSAELSQCEAACRACLSLNKGHNKAAYRLAAVLLALGRPEEAVNVADSTLRSMKEGQGRGGGASATDRATFESLQELRPRCLASCIVESKSRDRTRVDTGGPPSFSSSLSSTGTAGGRLSGQTAKILAQLQRRQDRERKREVHAAGSVDWKPSVDKEDAEKDKGSKGKTRKEAEAGVDEYFGQSNVYTGTARPPTTPTGAEGGKNEKGKKTTKTGAGAGAGASEEVDAKKKARKTAKAALAKALSKVRACVSFMQKADFSSAAVEAQSEELINALRAVQMSKGGAGASAGGREVQQSLPIAFKEGGFLLEEDTLTGCLLAFAVSAEPPSQWYALLVQLCACERFGSVLNMAVFGNDLLKQALAELRSRGTGMEGEQDARRALDV